MSEIKAAIPDWRIRELVISLILGCVLYFFGVRFIVSVFISVSRTPLIMVQDSQFYRIALGSIFHFCVLSVALSLCRFRKIKPSQVIPLTEMRPLKILVCMLAGIACALAVHLIIRSTGTNPDAIFKGQVLSDPNLFLYYALIALLVAPVLEEIVWRGFAFFAIERNFGAIVSAICVSLFFSLLHIPGEGLSWFGFILGLVPAMVLTFTRIQYKSLRAPIITHACFNLTPYVASLAWRFGHFG